MPKFIIPLLYRPPVFHFLSLNHVMKFRWGYPGLYPAVCFRGSMRLSGGPSSCRRPRVEARSAERGRCLGVGVPLPRYEGPGVSPTGKFWNLRRKLMQYGAFWHEIGVSPVFYLFERKHCRIVLDSGIGIVAYNFNFFTTRCTLVQSAVLRSHVVCLSVRPSVCLSVTLVDCDHIGWNSSKIISPLVSLGCSLFATPTWRGCSKGNTPKFGHKLTYPLLIWPSETFNRKLRPNGYR